MSRPRDGLAGSVRVRLARHVQTIGVDPAALLSSEWVMGGRMRDRVR